MSSEKFEELIKQIGKVKYQQLDENGKALGCLAPMYMAFPQEKGYRFDWCPEGQDMREYMLSLFDKHCERIPLDELVEGDFVTIKAPFGLYHFALYIGNDELLHCTLATGLTTVRKSLYEKRIERGYRFNVSGTVS